MIYVVSETSSTNFFAKFAPSFFPSQIATKNQGILLTFKGYRYKDYQAKKLIVFSRAVRCCLDIVFVFIRMSVPLVLYSSSIQIYNQHSQYFNQRQKCLDILCKMQVELEDYENGRPIKVNASKEVGTTIKVLKAKKQYKEIYDLTVTLPNNKDKYLMQANALMHLKKWKELDECCDRGLDIEEVSDFYNMKGKALGKMEQYHEKIELTKKAIEMEPKVAAYHRNLGAGYYKIKQYERAIESHNMAISLQPKNAINYHNKGAAFFRSQKYQEAKDCFKKAIDLDKKQVISFAWLADSQKELGEYDEAIHHYARAYELSGNAQYQKQKKALEEKTGKNEKKGFFSKIFG